MKLAIVTDAWEPQVNGVVTTLGRTRRELERLGHARERNRAAEIFEPFPARRTPRSGSRCFPVVSSLR